MTTSARSTSSRSTSSFRTRVSSRSKGPWKTSRSRSRTRMVKRLEAGPDAHALADVVQRSGRDRPCAVGPVAQDAHQLRLVVAQLVVALADRRQVVDDRVGHGALERAVLLALELLLDRLGRAGLDDREDVDQVGDPG